MALYNNLLRNTVKSLWNNNKDLSAKVDAGMVIGLVIITNLVTYFISDVLKIINIIGGAFSIDTNKGNYMLLRTYFMLDEGK